MRSVTYVVSLVLIIVGLAGYWWMSRDDSTTHSGKPVAPTIPVENRIANLASRLADVSQTPWYGDSALPSVAKRLLDRLRELSNVHYGLMGRDDEVARTHLLAELDALDERVAHFQTESASVEHELHDAYSEFLRVNQAIAFFDERGVSTARLQQDLAPHRKAFREGRIWWLDQMANLLAGEDTNPQQLAIGAAAIRSGRQLIAPTYQSVNSALIEAQQVFDGLKTLQDRLTWARGFRRSIPNNDPWLADEAHDLEVLARSVEQHRQAVDDLREDYLSRDDRARLAHELSDRATELIGQFSRVWIAHAKDQGYPLPK
ncbi:MAG: hypothetical protein KDB53_01075 [Planctomycetes bacterium]|nr:hypothetical protein [Planctomycetota bacterium]